MNSEEKFKNQSPVASLLLLGLDGAGKTTLAKRYINIPVRTHIIFKWVGWEPRTILHYSIYEY